MHTVDYVMQSIFIRYLSCLAISCPTFSVNANNHSLRYRHSRQTRTYDIHVDVVTNYGPECPLLCNLYKIWSVDFQEKH